MTKEYKPATIVELMEDEEGNLVLPLTEKIITELNWKEGDTIEWNMKGNHCRLTLKG